MRESTISGQVSVEGNGLSGVTVSLQGMGSDEEAMTDNGGQYTFDNLRAGEYQVAISGYDTREYGFETTSATIRVEHGKTANQPFEGIMLRTASIMGQVSVEGEGLPEVTVSLSGEGENQTTMTDNSGQYTFTDLPAGNFQVGISGYDTDDYSFETTSRNVSLALGATATVPFEGILLRTSGISGRVSVEGMGLDSVTVTLSGDDLEEDATAMTDASGQYAFAGLAEGDYTVAISDFDDVSYVFETTSMDVTLGDDDVQIHQLHGHARPHGNDLGHALRRRGGQERRLRRGRGRAGHAGNPAVADRTRREHHCAAARGHQCGRHVHVRQASVPARTSWW